jgi:hypothetical protein
MPTISFPQKERTSQQTGRTTDAYLIALNCALVSALSNGSALRRLGQVENGRGGSMLNNLSGPLGPFWWFNRGGKQMAHFLQIKRSNTGKYHLGTTGSTNAD